MLKLVHSRPSGVSTNSQELARQQRYALAELLRGTEDMLECAKQGDWSSVEAMERTRKADLVEFFRQNEKENSALLAQVIATLISLNDEITLLVEEAKNATSEEHQNLENGKRAAGSYLQYQDDAR